MRFPIAKRVFVMGQGRAVTPEPALPSLARRVVNFVGAMAQTANRAAASKPIEVRDVIADARHATCQSGCDFYRPSDDTCSHSKCGCKLKGGLISKTKLAGQKCPDGKWHAEPISKTPPKATLEPKNADNGK